MTEKWMLAERVVAMRLHAHATVLVLDELARLITVPIGVCEVRRAHRNMGVTCSQSTLIASDVRKQVHR